MFNIEKISPLQIYEKNLLFYLCLQSGLVYY